MAEVFLANGDLWYIRDYPDSEFEKTVGHQDLSNLKLPEKQAQRIMETSDTDFPYIGGLGELALSESLLEGSVISRDRIVTQANSSWLSGGEKQRLGKVYVSDFRKIFGEKYRKRYDHVNLALVDRESGIFAESERKPRKLYDSSTDLLVAASAGDLDESYDRMRKVRYDAATDIRRIADKVLERG